MRRTPVVLGVLSIVFGGLMALWCAAQLASAGYMSKMMDPSSMSLPAQPGQPNPATMIQKMQEAVAELRPITASVNGGMLLASLVLVVVGIGLVRRQPWARPASMLWGIVALVSLPVQIYVEAYIVLPKMQVAIADAFSGSPASAMMSTMAGAQTGMVYLKYLFVFGPFPVLLLILMGRASARNDLVT